MQCVRWEMGGDGDKSSLGSVSVSVRYYCSNLNIQDSLAWPVHSEPVETHFKPSYQQGGVDMVSGYGP